MWSGSPSQFNVHSTECKGVVLITVHSSSKSIDNRYSSCEYEYWSAVMCNSSNKVYYRSDCLLRKIRCQNSFSRLAWKRVVDQGGMMFSVNWCQSSVTCNTPIPSQNSVTRSAPIPSDAQGRSGARFHTSYNKKYVIKIITSEDVAEMHNILKKYHQVKGRLASLDTSCLKRCLVFMFNEVVNHFGYLYAIRLV